jgi:hypothetical protein
VVYDYGSTVVYQDNRVYYNAEQVATAEEYATQALDLATAGQAAKPAEQDEWQPLGVFALVQGEEKDANNIFGDQQGRRDSRQLLQQPDRHVGPYLRVRRQAGATSGVDCW